MKAAVTPRSFMAICAYDGQPANVGRVVTDATWHHFVNINIKPGMSALTGRNLADIKQYYANLATWLMPKEARLCRRFPVILAELMNYPLFEEISPVPRNKLDGSQLRNIGAQVEAALLNHYTHAEVKALINDALEEAVGSEAKLKLEGNDREIGAITAHAVGLAALGSLTMTTAERFNELGDKNDLCGEKAFSEVGKKAVMEGARLYLRHSRNDMEKRVEIMKSIAP